MGIRRYPPLSSASRYTGRHRHRRRAAGLAAALALSLSACGGVSAGGDAAAIQLVVADRGDADGSARDYWQRVVGAFEKRHPKIAVDVDVVPYATLDREVARRVAAGDAPDIAQATAFASYAEQDRLYSADDMLSIGTQADFVPALAEAGEVSHIQYGLPLDPSTPRLFYNKKLFKRAGIDDPPTTWAEVGQAAAALAEAGVRTPYALQLGPEAAEEEALSWLLANDGGYVGKGGSYTVDSPENAAALGAVRDELVAPGLTGPKGPELDRTEAYRDFAAGRVGMLLAHPALLRTADRAHVKYGTAAFPRRTGGEAIPAGRSDWLLAFKQRGHAQQIGLFLDFFYGDGNATGYASRPGGLPATVSAVQAMREDREYRSLWPFLDQLGAAQYEPVAVAGWPRVSRMIREEAAGAVSPSGRPAAVLTSIRNRSDSAQSLTS